MTAADREKAQGASQDSKAGDNSTSVEKTLLSRNKERY